MEVNTINLSLHQALVLTHQLLSPLTMIKELSVQIVNAKTNCSLPQCRAVDCVYAKTKES